MTMMERATQLVNQITQFQTQQNQQTNLSPFLQSGLDAIKNRDASNGERIANQILQQAGISREQAIQMARQRGLI